MQLTDLNTPALILDKSILDRNIALLAQRLEKYDCILRPHLKTCKSADIARRINPDLSMPVTVSTLHEAEYFLENGITDILYAVSIVPGKLKQVKHLQDKGAYMILLLDTVEAATLASTSALQLDAEFPCLVEVDCDGKRAGLKPEAPELIDVAKALTQLPGVQMKGVMTHCGGSYYCQGEEEMVVIAEQERTAITKAADRIQKAGFECPVVSMGSTPTVTFARSLDGVTEVRAGVYVFQDMVMQALGVCKTSDIALSVLSTVISHNSSENRILIDAGSLALSADPGKVNPNGDPHFGLVCHAEDCKPFDNLWVTSSNQEHGLISLTNTPYTPSDFPIGSQVRILPNHACITAAAYAEYQVVDGSDEITDRWQRCNRWG
ncbi:MAG: alanine racemase [Sneathiellales bacterium]|nr:alanine racemase [Sneathiellales bacterium]